MATFRLASTLRYKVRPERSSDRSTRESDVEHAAVDSWIARRGVGVGQVMELVAEDQARAPAEPQLDTSAGIERKIEFGRARSGDFAREPEPADVAAQKKSRVLGRRHRQLQAGRAA